MNLGGSYEVSIGDMAHTIAGIMGVDIDILTDNQRIRPEKSEVERLFACNSKAQQLMGWSPEYKGKEGFKNGLSKTIKWFSEPENLSFYKSGIYNI